MFNNREDKMIECGIPLKSGEMHTHAPINTLKHAPLYRMLLCKRALSLSARDQPLCCHDDRGCAARGQAGVDGCTAVYDESE